MRYVLIIVAICCSMAVPANAAITVDEVRADWNNVAGAVPTYFNTDGLAGNEEIRWGEPAVTNGQQSGYRFDSQAPPPFGVALDTNFSLGNFTHNNQPIFAPSISSAILSLTMDLTVDGNPVAQGPLTFDFGHNETPNSTGLPPFDNDIVSLTNLVSEDFFLIGTDMYTLFLRGFSTDGGTTFATEFSTVEGQANTAALYGYFSLRPEVIPEPGSIAVWVVLAGALSAGVASKKLKLAWAT